MAQLILRSPSEPHPSSSAALSVRAYSLIEMSVAMAIAGIITAVALTTYSNLVGSMFALRAQSRIDTQLQRVGRALAADLQEIGGGAIRPWHALFLQPTAGHPDRLLTLTADSGSRSCVVDEYKPSDGKLDLAAGCGACTAVITPGIENEYAGRFAVLSMPGSGEGRVVIMQERRGGACEYRAFAFVGGGDTAAADAAKWAGASFTVADAKWIFVDETTHELKAWLLYDSDYAPGWAQTPNATYKPRSTLTPYVVDERIYANNVYDFEVALGYDVNFDNVVAESVSGANDEWFGNAGGEIGVTDWIGDAGSEFTSDLVFDPSKQVPQIRLRSATIGLVMGIVARGVARAPVSILDGPDHTVVNRYFRATSARAMFRNAGATR